MEKNCRLFICCHLFVFIDFYFSLYSHIITINQDNLHLHKMGGTTCTCLYQVIKGTAQSVMCHKLILHLLGALAFCSKIPLYTAITHNICNFKHFCVEDKVWHKPHIYSSYSHHMVNVWIKSSGSQIALGATSRRSLVQTLAGQCFGVPSAFFQLIYF
jgi:hypothetical protein